MMRFNRFWSFLITSALCLQVSVGVYGRTVDSCDHYYSPKFFFGEINDADWCLCPPCDIETVMQYLSLIARPYPAGFLCEKCGILCYDDGFAGEWEYDDEWGEDEEESGCWYCYEPEEPMCPNCGYNTEFERDRDFAWEHTYFRQACHRWFPFFQEYLTFCSENKQCKRLWPELGGVADDINHVAYETFFQLAAEDAIGNDFHPEWEELNFHGQAICARTYLYFYSHYCQVCSEMEQHTQKKSPSTHKWAQEQLETCLGKIRPPFEELYSLCIDETPHPKLFYERGLLRFHMGRSLDSADDVRWFLDYSLANNLPVRNAELFVHYGEVCVEIGAYDRAIETLSRSIERNPHLKDAYLLRAQAYFETGQFSKAKFDYLAYCGPDTPPAIQSLERFELAQGMVKGLVLGGRDGLNEFIPNILGTVHGLATCLWAAVTHPKDVYDEFVGSALTAFETIREATSPEGRKKLCKEMADACERWDDMSFQDQGQAIGYTIGKYGIDILALSGAAKGVNAYKSLRKLNAMQTLEVLSDGAKAEAITEQALAYKTARQEALRPGNLKIEMNKQGKHIVGHQNFELKKSELWHQDPQKLLDKFAGKGEHVRGTPGQAGYMERVDIGEIIGLYRSDDGKIVHETTKATIHYSKKGVHIVPAREPNLPPPSAG